MYEREMELNRVLHLQSWLINFVLDYLLLWCAASAEHDRFMAKIYYLVIRLRVNCVSDKIFPAPNTGKIIVISSQTTATVSSRGYVSNLGTMAWKTI